MLLATAAVQPLVQVIQVDLQRYTLPLVLLIVISAAAIGHARDSGTLQHDSELERRELFSLLRCWFFVFVDSPLAPGRINFEEAVGELDDGRGEFGCVDFGIGDFAAPSVKLNKCEGRG